MVRSRLRELAAVRRRFGWRRLHVLLSREGVHVNHKKPRRLTSLVHARVALEEWHRDYNTERPHSALGNLTPVAYAARNASVPQQPGALRSTTGFAPLAVATPDPMGPNDERILLSTG